MSNRIKISCKEASFIISKKQETKISFTENLKLRLHILYCKTCTLFLKQTNFILLQLKKKNNRTYKLSSETKDKMQRQLDNEIG